MRESRAPTVTDGDRNQKKNMDEKWMTLKLWILDPDPDPDHDRIWLTKSVPFAAVWGAYREQHQAGEIVSK